MKKQLLTALCAFALLSSCGARAMLKKVRLCLSIIGAGRSLRENPRWLKKKCLAAQLCPGKAQCPERLEFERALDSARREGDNYPYPPDVRGRVLAGQLDFYLKAMNGFKDHRFWFERNKNPQDYQGMAKRHEKLTHLEQKKLLQNLGPLYYTDFLAFALQNEAFSCQREHYLRKHDPENRAGRQCPNFKELRKAFVRYLDTEIELDRNLRKLKALDGEKYRAAMKKCSEQSNLVQKHATKVDLLNNQRVSRLKESDDCDSNWTMRGMCGPDCVCHCTV